MSRPLRGALRGLLLLAFLVLVGMFVAARLVDLRAAWRAAVALSVGLLALAALAQLLRFVTSGMLVRSSARAGGQPVALGLGTEVFVASTSAGLLLGGAALTITISYRWLRERDLDVASASLASWLPTALDNAALLLPASLGLIALTSGAVASAPIAVGSSVTLGASLLFAAACVVAARYPRRAAAWLTFVGHGLLRLARRDRDLSRWQASTLRVLEAPSLLRRGRWQAPIFWSLLSVGFDALAMLLVFRAAHLRPGLLVVLTGFGLPQLVARLMPIPGGVGVAEAAMVGTYAALGVPHPDAIAVVFAYRLVSFWIPRIVGFAAVVDLERPARR